MNLASWIEKSGELLQPRINLLTEHIQQQPLIHMDVTALKVLDELGKPAECKSYLWLMATFGMHSAMVNHYRDNRSQAVPLELLTNQTIAIMVDGYEW